MSLTARELQQIKGIGTVLSVRLLEAGHNSFAKIIRTGESGLKEFRKGPKNAKKALQRAHT